MKTSARPSKKTLELFNAATRRAAALLSNDDLLSVEALINELLAQTFLPAETVPALTAVRAGSTTPKDTGAAAEAPVPQIWTSADVGDRLANEIALTRFVRAQAKDADGVYHSDLQWASLNGARPFALGLPAKEFESEHVIPSCLMCSCSRESLIDPAAYRRFTGALNREYFQPTSLTNLHALTNIYVTNYDDILDSCADNLAGIWMHKDLKPTTNFRLMLYRMVATAARRETASETNAAATITSSAEKPSRIEAAARIGGIADSTDEERAALERHFEWRANVLRGSLSTPEVGALLGITPQGVRKRIERKEVLAIKHMGDYRFPRWQFDPKSDSGVVRGLDLVMSAMAVDPISIAAWLTREQPSLQNRIPIDALKAGDVAVVVAEAESVGVT